MACLNIRKWKVFGKKEKKPVLDQVEQLKAELLKAQQEIVSLEAKNIELCETSVTQKSTIEQLNEQIAKQEARIQQLSENNTNQEAKIQLLCSNSIGQAAKIQVLTRNMTDQRAEIQKLTKTSANQDCKIQKLSAYLTAEEGENKTLWVQIKYLTIELEKSKKSVNDWKDLYQRERELHRETKKQKTDLEKELNNANQHLQAEQRACRDLEQELDDATMRLEEQQNLREQMISEEKQLRKEFNELKAAYEELQESHKTPRREHQKQQPQRETWSQQQRFSKQTNTDWSSQLEMEELKRQQTYRAPQMPRRPFQQNYSTKRQLDKRTMSGYNQEPQQNGAQEANKKRNTRRTKNKQPSK